MRHLRALPTLRGRWQVVLDRWIIPADHAAETLGIPYLILRPGNAGVRLQAVGG